MAGPKKAVKTKSKDTKVKKHHWKRWIAVILIVAVAAFFIYMYFMARTVRVRYATVYLSDLPESYDGTTILFASDIDLCGTNTAKSMDQLFDTLQDLNPDILLLGGDYASTGVIGQLNGSSPDDDRIQAFFDVIADFEAPLGKYAVSGENDAACENLSEIMASADVTLIDGQPIFLNNGSDTIALAGIGNDTDNITGRASGFTSDQCVILLMHTPDRIVDVNVAEASDGGTWADLILCGHTHGGQIELFGHSILSLTDTEKRYLEGWFSDPSPMLVTTGVGCEGVNLRLGSSAEVWLITLASRTTEE